MNVVELKEHIIERYNCGTLPHSFLIESNNVNKALGDIKNIVKVINCPEKYEEKCQKNCNLCKLIDNNTLPSLIIIEPDGLQIKKIQLNDMEERFATKPIYSRYNVYIIKDADRMNESAGNTILKFLEEPEDNILGIFITNNRNNVLSTIRSRCKYYKLFYEESSAFPDDVVKLSEEYLKEMLNDGILINSKKILTYNSNRDFIENVFLYIQNKYIEKLKESKNGINQNKKVVLLTNKTLQMIKYNVNLELVLDCFVIEMRHIYE